MIKIAYSVVRNLNNSSSLVFLRMRYQENSSLSVLVGIFSEENNFCVGTTTTHESK